MLDVRGLEGAEMKLSSDFNIYLTISIFKVNELY